MAGTTKPVGSISVGNAFFKIGDQIYINTGGASGYYRLATEDELSDLDESLAEVAKSGEYYDLLNKPDLNIYATDIELTDAQNQINLNNSKVTNRVTSGTATKTVTLTQLIGQYTKLFFKGGVAYKIAAIANEENREVSVNSSTGVVTSEVDFYAEPVWAEYQGISGGISQSGIVLVPTYADIMTHPSWGGNVKTEYYVFSDEQTMGVGFKGTYIYVPGFTPTPASAAINFNDQ